MPIFEYNGKKYNVKDEHIDKFMNVYPDASTIMECEGKRYRVKSSDYKTFLSKQPSRIEQEDSEVNTTSTEEVEVKPEISPTPTMGIEEETEEPISSTDVLPLTEQAKNRFKAGMEQVKRRTDHMMNDANERMATMREYHENVPIGGGQTAEGRMMFNTESGKMEKTYITPQGNRYASKSVADMESFRYRQAADMSVNGQLRRARQRLNDIDERMNERSRILMEEHERNEPNGLMGFIKEMGEAMEADRMGGNSGKTIEDEIEFQTDTEYQSLRLAKRKLEDQIQQLENYSEKESKGERFLSDFVRNTWQAITDVDAWDFGKNELRDARTSLQIANKANKGEKLSESEQDALYEVYMQNSVVNEFGDLGKGAKWGDISGGSLSFMKDFLLTGGFSGISRKLATKAATGIAKRAATRLSINAAESLGMKLAKDGLYTTVRQGGKGAVARLLAEQGKLGTAKIVTTRALGVTAEDLLIRAPLMVGTVQGQNTAAQIVETKLGPVVVDAESGELRFKDDKTWGEATWQAGADKVIENFSEMWGAHLPGMSDVTRVFGARNLTAAILRSTRPGAGSVLSKTSEFLGKVGVNGYFGEVGEEYYGQLWRTMLNLDSSKDSEGNNLFLNGEFHGDIWGGMAMSIGLTSATTMGVNYAGKGMNKGLKGAKYIHLKHMVNKSNIKASEALTPEVWDGMRLLIDSTDNVDMGVVATQIMTDKDMSDVQRDAVMEYMERTMIMRGYNLGEYAKRKNGEVQNKLEDELELCYIDGYNMEGSQEMNDAKNMLDYQRQRVLSVVEEEMLANIENDPARHLDYIRSSEVWNDEERGILLDYLNSKQVYDGMIQRVRDDIDGRIEQSNAMVDARTNRTTGMIQPATMKFNDRRVYVINGNVGENTEGVITDYSSSGSIIIRDAETGVLEQVSPESLLSIDDALDPNEEKQTAAEAIRQQYAQEAADKIDGVATFNPGDTYTITEDDAQMQVQIVANNEGVVDNGDGTVNVSDGTNVFPLSKETIQQQVKAAQLARVAQFEEQRVAENAKYEQTFEESNRPNYTFNDKVTLRDVEGNIIHGEIAEYNEADDTFVLDVDSPIGGKYAPMLTRAELESMITEYNGTAVKPIDVEDNNYSYENTNIGNNGGENIISSTVDELKVPETDNNAPQNIISPLVNELKVPAIQRIPKDEQGNPLYEQTDSDTAWDAIVEQTEGDEVMAQTVADGMVTDKEAVLKKLEKSKSKGGATISEKIAAEKERKAAIDAAQEELNIWKKIAGTANRRKVERLNAQKRMAEEAAALRKAEEAERLGTRLEAERIEREALNGVPDMVDDTPQDARARGYRRVSGHKIDRQEPVQCLHGKEVAVRFSDDTIANGRVAVIEASQLQPSHVQGQRNPLHFIDEAQPKERTDEASVLSARKIARNIRPEEITSSVTAYTGAPTINSRGEAIQGNSRSDALRQMWEGYQDQAAKYKQYLMDHAKEFGLNADEVASMKQPVLVNMLDVEDAEAITLGQYVAQDTESGGTERIKPKNAIQKMGNDMRSFANLLLKSADEETTFAGLLDNNGVEVLKWLSGRGYITPTQYKSAFDSKGNLTAEAKNDLRGIMYQSIFKGGSTRLEEMFNAMPAKAQKAILATAFRDYDSPNEERMIEEIQNSIRAFHALSQSKDFVNAKTFKDARLAVEGWKIQYQIDDVTGESYLPAENFSNFALLLATMYKGENQSIIQGTFNKLYDLIQGTQEPNLFEQPDNTPRTLAQAIYETLNITYDGQQRSNVLVGDSSASQRGQQGSTGDAATGERVENGERTADSAGGIDGDSRGIRIEGENRSHQSHQSEETHIPQTEEVIGRSLSADEAENFIADMEENADTAPDIELTIENWDALFGEEGTVVTPIGEVKIGESQFTKLMRTDRNGKLGMIKPTLENPHAIVEDTSEAKGDNVTERASSYVFIRSFKKADGSRYYYFTSVTVSKDGKEVVISNQEKSKKRISNLLQNGVISWINKNVQSVSEAQSEESVLLDDSQAATQADNNTASLGINSSELSVSKDTTISPITNELGEKSVVPSIQEQVQAAEAEVNTNPTEAQKEAGNYKKGHVQIGTFNVTIEQPKGSVRSGVDANGNKWETEMKNTYGYIRGTEGVDGDHIDVFLSDDIDGWNGRQVFVVDQRNEDGSFDEHKVMLGFNDINDAEAAYMSNYEDGWQGLGAITGVAIEDFEKWIASSHRKTKAFAEYKTVKTTSDQEPEKATLIEVVRTLYTKGKEVASKLFQRSFFDVAQTPKFMQELGLHGDKFTIKYGVIARHLGKDSSHTLTERDWEQLPQALQNPFAISKLTDKDNSYRIYTTLQTENGEFVVIGADVKNAGREIEVNAISTVFGRRNNGNLPKNEEMIYRSNEITPEQSSLLERPNFAQYPTEQELSDNKDTTKSHISKEIGENNGNEGEKVYKAVKMNTSYSIAPAQYTTKKGKVLDMHLVKFAGVLTKEQQRAAKELAKADKGWYDREQGGFMMRSEESAKQLAETILNNEDAVSDAQPVSLADTRKVIETEKPQQNQSASSQNGQDLTTGYSIDYGAVTDTKVVISNEGAKHELNNLIHKYAGVRKTRGFISDLAKALGDRTEKPKQTYYFEFKDKAGNTYTLRISNHNVNGENIGENEKEISIVIKSRRQPNNFIPGNVDVKEYVYFKESIANGDGQTLAWIAQDIATLLDTGEYADNSGRAVVNEVVKDVSVEPQQESQPSNSSGNRLVTDERYAELRERMRKKLGGQMNIGIDPEIFAIGIEMAVYHLEKGTRKFTEYAKAMIADLGDVIRPYLKAFYNGARNLPEVESSEIAADMTPYDEVQQFNVASFGKEHSDPFTTAEIVVAEQAHEQEVEQAKQKIINQRNTERRNKDEQTSADTETIASQAEAIASEAERIIDEATTEGEITEVEQRIDEQLNAIDEQLAKFDIDNLHSGMRVILKDGRNVLISMVMHHGEQLSATQFSKPRVHRLYALHKGQFIDFTPEEVDIEATRRILVGKELGENNAAKAAKAREMHQSGELGLFDSLFADEEKTLYELSQEAASSFEENFSSGVKCKNVILENTEDLYNFAIESGESEEKAKYLTERYTKNDASVGFYSDETDSVVILSWNGGNPYLALFHENVHRAVTNLGGIKQFKHLSAELKALDPGLLKQIIKHYREEDIEDEIISYSLETALSGNAIKDLRDTLGGKFADFGPCEAVRG